MEYQEFLNSKTVKVQQTGLECSDDEVNEVLFEWQRAVVAWAVRLGKAALFEECGLGKTLQQIEWARIIQSKVGGKFLIVSPLAVAHQTVAEGKKINVQIEYVRSQEAAEKSNCNIVITNYEMLKEFDGGYFMGVVLDESSILKSFTGATKRMILNMFEGVRYKLACTATPAPNDHLELGNHAQFLDVMASNEMIQRWFINDSMAAGNYRLKGHAEKDYWQWVTTWAVSISTPSDIGYPDKCDAYDFNMPELKIEKHIVGVDHSRAHEYGQLILMESLSATGMWKEKKITAYNRCLKAQEIVGDSDDNWIIWCDTNNEADILIEMFPEAVEVRGSQSIPIKESGLSSFSNGTVKQIITKPDIAGFGLNWQHCSNQIFVGVTYSFEKTYQALRRSWRFGQSKDVYAHIIYSETEGDIMTILQNKQEAHHEMQLAMNAAMSETDLSKKTDRLKRMDSGYDNESGNDWTMMLGDCVERIADIETGSVDFSVYSPPFSNLYIYSDAHADMGNSADDAEFFEHYKYLISEMERVTRPGRISAVHCKDLPLYANRDGAAGLKDFPGMIIKAHEECGWTYHSRVTIWKDPVIEMQRTKNHGLLHKNWAVRSEVVRQGMADYMIMFRKWDGVNGTESTVPISHVGISGKNHDFKGDNPPVEYDSDRDYSIQVWQRYASPVWYDIRQTNVLNCRAAREDKDEKHICPLQLDVIERCIDIWTNPGELVLSPFAGIGSEGYSALKMNRKFIGIELKQSYYEQAIRNLQRAVSEKAQVSLFDMSGL